MEAFPLPVAEVVASPRRSRELTDAVAAACHDRRDAGDDRGDVCAVASFVDQRLGIDANREAPARRSEMLIQAVAAPTAARRTQHEAELLDTLRDGGALIDFEVNRKRAGDLPHLEVHPVHLVATRIGWRRLENRADETAALADEACERMTRGERARSVEDPDDVSQDPVMFDTELARIQPRCRPRGIVTAASRRSGGLGIWATR